MGKATPELWATAYQVNAVPAVRMIRAFVPGMCQRGWGRVIRIGGGLAVRPKAVQPQYSATLAARHNSTVSLARDLKGPGVTSNVVSPGPVLVVHIRDRLLEVGPSPVVVSAWTRSHRRPGPLEAALRTPAPPPASVTPRCPPRCFAIVREGAG
ncbi:SDR family NAD(P)-dependent oxidoreductase [Streptomyces uncialis]|uniref:SDR family NAD(P)-dependent oxidoreductase n=1 Tax=Streptomyces uncialis TaxID=1048205 RepID=UPI003868C6B2|nr:SDR family oxidoreductase [Streptomyces uncialis]